MTASSEEDEADVPRRRAIPRLGRAARIIFVVALVVLVLLIGLWSQRKPIAAHYVDAYLAERGVAATYDIADLGFGRQRLTNVVLGDPKRPDLVADWIELGTNVGFSGAQVLAVRVGHVRLRGSLNGGTLSLGALDRLMPPPSGKPFSLPEMKVEVADARMRLETPQGLVGLKLVGRGNLNDGFSGTLAAVSDRLAAGACVADRAAAALRVSIARAKPSLEGPVHVGTIDCGETRVANAGADLKVALGAALDSWRGDARIATGSVRHPFARVASLAGRIDFAGDAKATGGAVKLDSGAFATTYASGGRVGIAGQYSYEGRLVLAPGSILDGERIVVAPSQLGAVRRLAGQSAGTPVGPLAEALAQAVERAGRSFDGGVTFGYDSKGPIQVSRITLASASGLKAALNDADMAYDPGSGALRLAGALSIGGGGFPEADVTLSQARPGAPVTGVASLRQPFAANGASLAFTPLRFSATPGGNSRFATRLTLSGPLGDGRVDGLDVPVEGIWNGGDRLAINPDCGALAFQRLAVSGLVLRPASLRLCPISGAILRFDGGRLSGGASIAAPRLSGALGSTPVTLAAAGSQIRLGEMGFGLRDLAVRIGSPERVTRLDFADLTGKVDGRAVKGAFKGGAGQIANVPLLMSAATGDWTLKNGALGVTAALTVGDAAPDPRFKPLEARNVALGLKNGVIGVGGELFEPIRNVKVTDIAIRHDLAKGSGSADLNVAGLNFVEKGLQPDDLTRLTVGVIASVNGKVSGEGHIRWSPDAVTSDGVFRTAGTDLAAALGPVTGISTEIRFTDLLNLQSAPGQIATIKTINTGISVENGTIRYQTLPNARVQVEEGRWPFAGGSLVLEPTLLDFSDKQQRYMTLTVTGMEAAKFLAQFEFDNLNATGVFDGSLPMVFDDTGGRITGGRLKVRQGGGTIAYLGQISKENLGVWGNLAFQALKSLRYRELELVMNGPLSGEMITEAHFAGLNQGEGAKSNFLIRRLQQLPFVFNVHIRAPFRGLFDSARSFYDPNLLVERKLPELIEQRDRQRKSQGESRQVAPPPVATIPESVQPQESETMP